MNLNELHTLAAADEEVIDSSVTMYWSVFCGWL